MLQADAQGAAIYHDRRVRQGYVARANHPAARPDGHLLGRHRQWLRLPGDETQLRRPCAEETYLAAREVLPPCLLEHLLQIPQPTVRATAERYREPRQDTRRQGFAHGARDSVRVSRAMVWRSLQSLGDEAPRMSEQACSGPNMARVVFLVLVCAVAVAVAIARRCIGACLRGPPNVTTPAICRSSLPAFRPGGSTQARPGTRVAFM